MSAVGASSTSAMVMDGELREQKASGSEDFKKVVPSAAGKVSEDTSRRGAVLTEGGCHRYMYFPRRARRHTSENHVDKQTKGGHRVVQKLKHCRHCNSRTTHPKQSSMRHVKGTARSPQTPKANRAPPNST